MINEGESGALVEEWIELANGCVCCSVKHSFVQALEQLLERRDRFDHILLETTGLANPGPIASLLWIDDQLESAIHLDSIITVVDAKNLWQQLGETREAEEITEAHLQIAFADVVILNKVDLIDGGELEGPYVTGLIKEIQSINGCAKIVKSIHCNVNLEDILDCKSYDTKRFSELYKKNASFDEVAYHNPKVTTLSISGENAVDLQKVNDWLGDLLWEKGVMEIYRIKGVLYIRNSDQIHLLQAVRELYEIIPGRSWRQDEKCANKLVFIGKYLNEEILLSSFESCFG
ncbi:hypothetical protein O6H91_06G114800 [Diphasiastrum complanatum]|nr:hypothetical protein O6H91_06G114300 [Diphasiastrum complanatum]KAJ7553830.1 hypothetical protein O6H91_06G114800 [Diphasiastrum complanatum]